MPTTLRAAVLGVDGCTAGWVGVLLAPDGSPQALVAAGIGTLVDLAERRCDSRPVVVGIDIPIGLPDRGRRLAEAEARRALPGKGSSVFPTLVRAAYEAPDYASGRAEMLAATTAEPGGPRSCSAQAWNLGRKILEVDAWARLGDPGTRVAEVHPEVSFAALAGAPVLSRKRTAQGRVQRRALLAEAGIEPPEVPRGAAPDDLLDACAAAWSAARILGGASYSLPDPPEITSDGWPAAIHV